MSKQILGLDDSAVMRKALEYCFEADELTLFTAANLNAALASGTEPSVLLVDTVLGNDDGYAAGKALKERWPQATLVFLTSRHAPLDVAKAQDAGSDGNIDKPFDSQALIDKVHQLIAAQSASAAAPPRSSRSPSVAAFRAPSAPTQGGPRQIVMPHQSVPASSVRIPGTRPGAEALPSGVPAQPPRISRPAMAAVTPSPGPASAPTEVQRAPAPQAASPSTVPPRSAVSAGHEQELRAKLSPLQLSTEQQDAVLHLTRELVERVVWEVVPTMAETLIREELARLTR